MITSKFSLIESVCRSGAVQRGSFTLKSGRTNPVYIDLRRLTLSGDLPLVIDAIRDAIWIGDFNAVGGPSVGADPIVGGLLAVSGIRRGFLVRLRAKDDHGLADIVIGSVQPGDQCLIVDDVTTSGSSLFHAIDAVEHFGAKVIHAVTILDRAGEVDDLLKKRDIKFTAILTLADLGITEN